MVYLQDKFKAMLQKGTPAKRHPVKKGTLQKGTLQKGTLQKGTPLIERHPHQICF